MNDIPATIDINPSEGKPTRILARLLTAAFALVLGACATGPAHVKDTSRTFTTVVIDAGHGGVASGTRSRWGGQEKTATLAVAQKLDPKLRAAGFRTVMTRNQDVDVSLEKRALISNRQDNAVFVSIHFNEAGSRAISGTETYYKSRPSVGLASQIQRQVASLPGHSSRGVKTANFRVLRLNEYPAVLVECGFLSNPSEGSRCANPAHQDDIAAAIARGIIAQRGGPLKQ